MKKLFFFLLAFTTLSYNIVGQGKIQFDITTHEFGELKEEMGRATATFTFTNVGNADLKVVNVKTSCGCTASDYSKNIIKPGEKGFVKATYTTTGRPGPFRKSITVTTDDVEKPNTVLFITGTVLKKSAAEADKYPITIGNLRLINNHIAFNDVKNTETKTDSVKIFNNWNMEMTIGFDQVPPYISAVARNTTLKPQESTFIVITYNGSKRGDFGQLYDRIAIVTNDIVQPMKILNISATIVEDFSALSPKALKKAPKIVFNNTDYQFEPVKAGEVITYRFTFTNKGRSNLIIRKTKASCGCTAIEPESSIVKKGKSSYIEIKFDTRGRTGTQHKTVTIITNDPTNPEVVLNIHGEVLKQ